MYANDVAVASFEELTAPLFPSGPGLTAGLRGLEALVRTAVTSLLGWSLTIKVDGGCVTLTSVNPATTSGDVRASLEVPLSAFVSADLSGGMVFYASAPYAFSRLRRDFVPTFGPALCRLRLDQDLNPDLASVVSGVREMSTISRLISVLVAGGDTPGDARDRLQAAAVTAKRTLHQTATELLRVPSSATLAIAV
jgi:hypothetical protein